MKALISLLFLFTSLTINAQRSTGIELEVIIDSISENIIDTILDIEYSSKEGYYILWVHEKEYKPFTEEYFDILNNTESCFNRSTETDHLNLYIEYDDTLTDIDIYENGYVYKNMKFSSLDTVNNDKLKTKKKISTYLDVTDWILDEYVIFDEIRTETGINYSCIKAHKTKETNKPPDSKYWTIKTTTTKDWVLDEDLIVGDIRIVLSISYKCIKAHKAKEDNKPPDTKYWELY